MKMCLTAYMTVDIDDGWLEEMWDEADITTPVDRRTDFWECASGTVKERLTTPGPNDPVAIHVDVIEITNVSPVPQSTE